MALGAGKAVRTCLPFVEKRWREERSPRVLDREEPGPRPEAQGAPATERELLQDGLAELVRGWDAAEVDRLTQKVFAQKRRVADAERTLLSEETKKTREDIRIGANKMKQAQRRLDALKGSAGADKSVRKSASRPAPALRPRITIPNGLPDPIQILRPDFEVLPGHLVHCDLRRVVGRLLTGGISDRERAVRSSRRFLSMHRATNAPPGRRLIHLGSSMRVRPAGSEEPRRVNLSESGGARWQAAAWPASSGPP